MSHPDDGVLQELLDGELAPADEAVVRAHIAGCAPCTTALAELKAIQAEADTIVSRLPLDPPLPARQVRSARPPRRDLRMLGLAASAVLVAGTSWLLFRSPNAALRPEAADTASGIALPLPAQEREEVGAATRAPAAPAAPADVAPPRPLGKTAGENFELRGNPSAAARKDEAAAAPEKDVANAALRSTDAVAAKAAPSPSLTLADAEARVGGRLLTIDSLAPQSVEVVREGPDTLTEVRQTYIVGGVPVILVQRGVASHLVTMRARDEVTTKQAVAEQGLVEKEKKAQAFAAGSAAAPAVQPAIQRRIWEADGVTLWLPGPCQPIHSMRWRAA